MIEVFTTNEFNNRYRELPPHIRKKAEKREIIFRENPFYPSLHTEKLEPKSKQVWSFRIDREYRINFRFLDNKNALFLTCGHHHWIYRYKI